ncbi:MAG: EAL domain-containing protein, partial [Microthrixaceae bacterium]
QPIVSLHDGTRVGAEALSRFPAEWQMAPDEVFAQAALVHADTALEMLAFRRAADHLEQIEGYLAINFSPSTLLEPGCRELLADLPAERVLLELSEHDPVADYPELASALAPLRASGMRLAIDDVGAGYSSLRHILMTEPDVIKLDRSIAAGAAGDEVLATLVGSLVDFAHGCGAVVVAEGIETAADAEVLGSRGVDHGQGWYFGRPGPPDALMERYDTAPGGTVVSR